MGYPPVKTPRS